MKTKSKVLVVFTSILLFMSPCFVWAVEGEEIPGTSPTPSNPPEQEKENYKITLDQNELNLNVGESKILTATVTPDDSEVIWESDNKDIAEVDATGKVTAKDKAGTAKITATIKGTDTKATCTVSVTRSVGKDATLKSLKIKNGTLNEKFDPNVFEYSVNIDPDVTELDIDCIPSDEQNARVFKTNNSNLKNGSIVELKVIAEDKETNHIYKLKIVKEEEKTTSLNLKSLEINGYALNETFKATTTKYTANIPYEIDTITVEANAEDEDATVTVTGNKNLKVGENTVSIVVKDSQGNSKNYQIIVTRDKEKPTSIITSSTDTSSNAAGIIHSSDSNQDHDDFFKYLIVSIACLILLAIGGIGIYFYIKTSPRRLKKELSNHSHHERQENSDDEIEESPIVETSSFASELPKEEADVELEKTKELKKEELLEMLFDDEKDV